MNAMKGRLLAGVTLPFLLAVPAKAQDLTARAAPVRYVASPASHDWSGFYVGVNVGRSRASSNSLTSASCADVGFPLGSYFNCGDISSLNAAGTGAISHSLFTGGAQAGYNWQFNSAVIGIEADFGSFRPHPSRAAAVTLPVSTQTATITSSANASWLFTARGRLGWAFDTNILGYVTGGLAVTNLRTSNSYADDSIPGFNGGGNVALQGSATKVGWTLGAGAEYAVSRNWSLRAEYLHVHFDAIASSGLIADTPAAYGSAIDTSTDLSAHIARVGINYKF